jgi:hypothetical protein
MTHDELLEKIENKFNNHSVLHEAQIVNALYRVVELHKPLTTPNNFTHCPHCQYGNASGSYPCATIQAIEKELK